MMLWDPVTKGENADFRAIFNLSRPWLCLINAFANLVENLFP